MPKINGYGPVEGEPLNQGRHILFAAEESGWPWLHLPTIPKKPPTRLISLEIHAATCGWCFLPRHIHEKRLPGFPVPGELVRFPQPHSAYGAACWAVTKCVFARRHNRAIFARRPKLSHLFNDVTVTLSVFMKFAATRTFSWNGEC